MRPSSSLCSLRDTYTTWSPQDNDTPLGSQRLRSYMKWVAPLESYSHGHSNSVEKLSIRQWIWLLKPIKVS